jgi:D-alanyl-D-alanine carboxypeptidase
MSPFVPASVTKIVTAWLALEVLGGEYRFETRFYGSSRQPERSSSRPVVLKTEMEIWKITVLVPKEF